MTVLRLLAGTLRLAARTIGYGTLGALVVLIALFVVHLENRPDLAVWHEAELDAEFTADSDALDF